MNREKDLCQLEKELSDREQRLQEHTVKVEEGRIQQRAEAVRLYQEVLWRLDRDYTSKKEEEEELRSRENNVRKREEEVARLLGSTHLPQMTTRRQAARNFPGGMGGWSEVHGASPLILSCLVFGTQVPSEESSHKIPTAPRQCRCVSFLARASVQL